MYVRMHARYEITVSQKSAACIILPWDVPAKVRITSPQLIAFCGYARGRWVKFLATSSVISTGYTLHMYHITLVSSLGRGFFQPFTRQLNSARTFRIKIRTVLGCIGKTGSSCLLNVTERSAIELCWRDETGGQENTGFVRPIFLGN